MARVPAARPYYMDLGRATDCLLRCKDCNELVPEAVYKQLGSCKCGNKRFNEIRTLSQEEYDAIAAGTLDFPYRDEFLREFAGIDVP